MGTTKKSDMESDAKKDEWDDVEKAKDCTKKGAKKASKSDDPSVPDDDEDDEGDDDDMGKSMAVRRSELEKSHQTILRYLETNDPAMRKQALLLKASSTADISAEERAELISFLMDKDAEEALSERVAKSMTSNESLNKSMQGNAFNEALCKSLIDALKEMATFTQKSHRGYLDTGLLYLQHQRALSKSVMSIMDEMEQLKANQERIAEQPVGGPRSMGIANEKPIARKAIDIGASNGRATPAETTPLGLESGDVQKGLRGLMAKSQNPSQANGYAQALRNYQTNRSLDDRTARKIAEYLEQSA